MSYTAARLLLWRLHGVQQRQICAQGILDVIDALRHALLAPLRSAAALLAGGCVLLQQGQDVEAKQRLSKALKLAHGPLASHQLVAQARKPCKSNSAVLPCRVRWPDANCFDLI